MVALLAGQVAQFGWFSNNPWSKGYMAINTIHKNPQVTHANHYLKLGVSQD